MDRLAREGSRFAHGISNSPICMPARSLILSGQPARTCTGLLTNFQEGEGKKKTMPEHPFPGRPFLRAQTLPEGLQAAGYHTGVIGKWHVHSRPADIGFDYSLIPRVHHRHTGQRFTENGGEEFLVDGYSVDWEAERVGDFLEHGRPTDKPFFLYYNISPPHMPLADAPETYRTMYAREEVELRPNCFGKNGLYDDINMFRIYLWDFLFYDHLEPHTLELPEDFDLQTMIALYYGLTTWVDDTLGKLMDNLARLGLDENTLVVFASDHGDMLGSHHRVNKGVLFEESIRVPLIARGPSVEAGAVCEQQIGSLLDLAPTFLDFAGTDIPAHMTGQSLAPVLRCEQATLDRDAAFIENPNNIGIRTLDTLFGYKDVEGGVGEGPLPEAKTPVLYDLKSDPYQMNNCAEDPEFAGVRAELEARLLDWHAQTPWFTES